MRRRFTLLHGSLAAGVTLAGCAHVAVLQGPSPHGRQLDTRPNGAIRSLLMVGAPDNPSPEFFLPHSAPTDQELVEPPVLPNSSTVPGTVVVDITASQRALQLLDGPPTTMVVFNGSYPGPALEVHEGDRVTVHFHNRSPIPVNVHYHGLLIPTEQDGNPENAVPPGGDQDYVWTAPTGFPMSSFYHTHAHGFTHIGVVRGLEAPLRVLAANDPIPAAYGHTTLFLADNKFTANNQIPPDDEYDRINGREGNVIFVNGQVLPKLTLRPGEIRRLRIGDFASARFFHLGFAGLHALQVGTDGGPINRPVPIDDLLLANAERADVLIQAPSTPGKSVPILLLPYDRGLGPDSKRDVPLTLLTVVTAGQPITQPPVPTQLGNVVPLQVGGAGQRTFELGLPSISGGVHHFGIDHALFDPARIDNVTTFGGVEYWTIANKDGSWDHPMHLHSTQFQVLDVDGKPPITGPAWKDTVDVPKGAVAHLAVPFQHDPGLYMFHCHILQHENDGMMTDVMVGNGPAYKIQNPPATDDKNWPSKDTPFPPVPFAGGSLAAGLHGGRWCGPNGQNQPLEAQAPALPAALGWWSLGAVVDAGPTGVD